MRIILSLLLFFIVTKGVSQTSYESKIEKLAKDISATFIDSQNIRIGFVSFLFNESQTKLTQAVYDDLIDELVAINPNQSKQTFINNSKLIATNEYNEAISETDKAILLKREINIDYVVFGKITEHDSGYKIHLRLYETKEGNISNSFKSIIDKTNAFETMNAQILEDKTVHPTVQQNYIPPPETPKAEVTQEEAPQKPEVIKEKKPKKQREGKFWKALGDMALNTLTTTVNKVVDDKLQPKSASTGTSVDQNSTGSTDSGVNTSSGNSNGGYDNSSGNSNTSPTDNQSCRAYINLINKTQNTIVLAVYKENPNNSYGVREIFNFTLAPGRSKKQKVDKDFIYYYRASNNTGMAVVGGYREYNGTFEVEKCEEAVDEEIN